LPVTSDHTTRPPETADAARAPGGAGRDTTRMMLLGEARGWAGRWQGGLLLVAICLAVLLPGLFTLPPIDRDESRFAQASRQMLESGDFVVPRVQDRPRLNKPPLIYWLQAASAAAFTGGDASRDAIWMYRLPGAACMLLAVLATWRIGCALGDPRAALLGATLLAICPLVVIDAHQARADQLLLLTTTIAMCGLWRVLRGGGRLAWVGLWLAVGAGVMAKGPVTPMVVLFSAAVWAVMKGDWRGTLRTARPLLGLAIVGACVAPWVVAVGGRVGWDVYLSAIVDETLGRSVGAKEGHWGPPGYHLLLLVALFFPGSILTGLAFVRTLRSGLRRRPLRWDGRDADLFLLTWIVPAWIVFELISTKLPHYTMPLYPAVALLTARTTLRASAGLVPEVSGFVTRLGFAAWMLVGLACLCGGLTVLAQLQGPGAVRTIAYVLAGIVLTLLVSAWLAARFGRVLRALLLAGVASVGAIAASLGWLLPRSDDLWITRSITGSGAWVRSDPVGKLPIAASGYAEDSLMFETRGHLVRLADDRDAAAAWLRVNNGLLIVRAENAPGGMTLAQVRGFNYSRGRWETVLLVRRGPGGAP